ncbi:MAG: DNA repair protein RadC [Bacillota bacterium]|nr:DNA repair protein RadC [Bacillota bacterium]
MHDGHRKRLKDRFLSSGLKDFEEHNVLELLLFYAIPRIDTNTTAHRLIKEFGSLANVLDAPYELLCEVEGVGENAATFIKLIPEVCKKYIESRGREVEGLEPIDSPARIIKNVLPKLIGKRSEMFVLMCLDNKRKVLFCDTIFEGTVNSTDINIRKIVETVIRFNASAVAIAHNHPGGIALPSAEDIATTRKIQEVLDLMNVKLIDHIIVADNDTISFAESHFLHF